MIAAATEEARTMRAARGAALAPLPATAHLLQPVIERAAHEPGGLVAAYRDGDHYVDITALEFSDRVREIAKGFIGCGVRAGDRVALMAHTRLEWLLVEYAILAAGGVTVPVYETSSAEQLQWIVADSGAVLVVVETATMATLLSQVADDTSPRLRAFTIDDGGLDELVHRGGDIDDDALDRRIAALSSDLLATIVYTSGTTGRPKGCALTHGNLRTNVQQNLDAIDAMLEPGEVSLVFLPLAHVLMKIIALVSVECGIKMAFATDVSHLQEELAMVEPTMIVAVPRVFEKVYNAAQHRAHGEGHGALFDKAVEVAIRWSRNRAARRPRPITEIEHAVMERLVYRKMKAVFGGRMRFAFSGGGPLGERLTHLFHAVGVQIFEGYGLTETSPTLTINRADAWKAGTVGRPLAGTSIRLGDDGEILAKGPQVFRGYWHNDAATAEVFDDEGWFRTGDLGTIDDQGFLRITGRKKELIVTASGKNVAPAPLEDRLRAHPLISQAVVVGDARPFIAALIALDADSLAAWTSEHGVSDTPMNGLIGNVDLVAAVQAAVDDANRSVSRAESIRKFALLPADLSIARGELTPTLKVRRAVVERRYAALIEKMYA
jgi:long-chain acyl-CoA synthetase